MSRRPVPAAVFWRRRLLVVALVIALAYGVLQVVERVRATDDDGGSTAPAPQPTSAPTATAGPVQVSVTTDERACDPQKIRVTPTVRPRQEHRGAVDIGLVVSTTEKTSCTLQPDDADLVAIISANDTPIWDSTLCTRSLLTEPVQVSADWATLEVTQWSGRVSGSNCSNSQDWASPGDYRVQAGTLGGEPGETTFTLNRRPAEPKPSETPSETPDDEDEE